MPMQMLQDLTIDLLLNKNAFFTSGYVGDFDSPGEYDAFTGHAAAKEIGVQ